jgi:hypothetical protein
MHIHYLGSWKQLDERFIAQVNMRFPNKVGVHYQFEPVFDLGIMPTGGMFRVTGNLTSSKVNDPLKWMGGEDDDPTQVPKWDWRNDRTRFIKKDVYKLNGSDAFVEYSPEALERFAITHDILVEAEKVYRSIVNLKVPMALPVGSEEGPLEDIPDDARPFDDPYYWAAFVVIGDTFVGERAAPRPLVPVAFEIKPKFAEVFQPGVMFDFPFSVTCPGDQFLLRFCIDGKPQRFQILKKPDFRIEEVSVGSNVGECHQISIDVQSHLDHRSIREVRDYVTSPFMVTVRLISPKGISWSFDMISAIKNKTLRMGDDSFQLSLNPPTISQNCKFVMEVKTLQGKLVGKYSFELSADELKRQPQLHFNKDRQLPFNRNRELIPLVSGNPASYLEISDPTSSRLL